MGGTTFSILYGLYSSSQTAAKGQESRSNATRSDMQGYWETYQKWGQDASIAFDKNITGEKARMSASGIKAGSDQWETNLTSIESEYSKQKSGFDTGVTGSALSNWAKAQQEKRTGRGATSKKGVATLNTSEYLTQEFGALDLTKATTVQETATKNDRQAAAGNANSGTASPWWG